jgi:hypothetical protein
MFPDEIIEKVVAAYREHGSQEKAAEALGTSRGYVQRRLHVAAQRGLLLDHKPAMSAVARYLVV